MTLDIDTQGTLLPPEILPLIAMPASGLYDIPAGAQIAVVAAPEVVAWKMRRLFGANRNVLLRDVYDVAFLRDGAGCSPELVSLTLGLSCVQSGEPVLTTDDAGRVEWVQSLDETTAQMLITEQFRPDHHNRPLCHLPPMRDDEMRELIHHTTSIVVAEQRRLKEHLLADERLRLFCANPRAVDDRAFAQASEEALALAVALEREGGSRGRE